MEKHCIIVAAGQGTRVKSSIPKQFIRIHKTPILIHSINAFMSYDPSINIILVLSPEHHKLWHQISKEFNLEGRLILAHGGATRFFSVKNGLDHIKGGGYTAVHDGARPLISPKLIDRCFKNAEKMGTAIPCISLTDSVRYIEKGRGNKHLDRKSVVLIQTPQVFKTELLRKSYQQDYQSHFTDDATVIEQMGVELNLIDGDPGNIKITTNEDLRHAIAILSTT